MTFLPTELEADVALVQKRFADGDVLFLSERLPNALKYLLCLDFPEKVTYLDIETTGLSKVYHSLTLIGWTCDMQYKYELLGNERIPSINFLQHLSNAPLIVTFNGNLFDLPFLKSRIDLPPLVSIDLRFLSKRLGYAGGQKGVEEKLGINRPEELKSLKGEDAPGLWFRATRGDRSALEQLIEYNFHDILGMQLIFNKVVPKALAQDQLAKPINAMETIEPSASIRMARDWKQKLEDEMLRIASSNFPRIRLKEPGLGVGSQIIGIDLTGSERRATGIASITGRSVEVTSVATDQEILQFVIAKNPKLVSIDAPLSLPRGRTRVTDDDPNRLIAGIMRQSERELKRRGVNVYPCLLPSMQGLTSRGIRLANEFRKLGIPTIESYPGGAQDILAMPRKGVGTEFLEQSLRDIGLELKADHYSHDELDAITSAIVGVLFLNGMYEALGNRDEEAMIVPNLSPPQTDPQIVVALSGEIASGKTTASQWFLQNGYTYARYSIVVSNFATSLGHGPRPDRRDLQEVGKAMHDQLGQRAIGKLLVESLENASLIVIDGLRFREDCSFLREIYGNKLVHIHMESSRETRIQRLYDLGESSEDSELVLNHEVEAESGTLGGLADFVVVNEATVSSLYQQIANLHFESRLRKVTRVLIS